MSLKAIVWAFDVHLPRASMKLTLVALADYANEQGICYPSIKTLSLKTSLDRKTVIRCLAQLEEDRLIRDTGKTCGSTNQVKVYALNPNSPKNGTVSTSKSPVFPIEQSRFSHEQSQKRDTEPISNRTDGTTSTTPDGVEGDSLKKKKEEEEEAAVEIYGLYPRKIGRPAALKQIKRALKKYPRDKLMDATAKFAECWLGSPDMQFCPHPATWFHNERFNDDPATWVRKESAQSLGPLHGQIKAIEEAIARHPCNPDSRFHDEDASPALREGYKSLKTKLEILKKRHTEAIMVS